jgi:enoyl-CoA hydratase/carnithine racemase
VYEIKLSGPGKNSLGTRMMESIIERLDAACGDAVLFVGDGDAFSAGLDLKEVHSLDEPGMVRFLTLLERCMCAVYLYPGPTAAAVNGHAIAGGCVLTLACDVRVATTSARAKIGLNEVALGLRFPPRIFQIVRGRIPPEHLEDVILGAGLFAPADAMRLGLVDEAADDPRARAESRLAYLAMHPRAAYGAAKHDLRGARDEDIVSVEDEAAWFRSAIGGWTSPELKAKIGALLAPTGGR